jgi:two-component system, sensor histidine kinase LadS
MAQLLRLLGGLLFALLAAAAQAQTPPLVQVNDTTLGKNILPRIEALPDPTGRYTAAQVAQAPLAGQFKPLTGVPHITADGSEVGWLRFSLQNQLADSTLVFDFFNQFDSVELHTLRNGAPIKLGGLRRDTPSDKRPIHLGLSLAFLAKIAPGQTQVYYVRVQQIATNNRQNKDFSKSLQSFKLARPEVALSAYRQTREWGLAFVGILFIMGFYCLVLYTNVKDRSYLYFGLYLLASFSNSLYALLMPDVGTLQTDAYWYFTSTVAAGILFLWFSQEYLQLSRHSRWGTWAVRILMGGQVLFLVASLFDIWLIYIITAAALLVTPIMLAVGITVYRKKFRPAKYYLLGNVAYLLGRLVFLAVLFQVIDAPNLIYWTSYAGSTLQIFLFATGLFYRINQMRQEAEASKEAHRQLVEQQNATLEREVAARTAEIRVKNEELLASEEELRQNMEELEANKEALEQTLQVVQAKGKVITDSIRYAQTIQSAILPQAHELQGPLADHFVLFKPKDVVSGDFYWAHRLATAAQPELELVLAGANGAARPKVTNGYSNGTTVLHDFAPTHFLAVVDCTGHGVPGAFMSMIGHSILNEVVGQGGEYRPEHILATLDQRVRLALKQTGSSLAGNVDGMDVALVALQRPDPQGPVHLAFAGARRPLWYVRAGSGRVQVLSGARKSVGGGLGKADQAEFTTQYLELHPGDRFYLFSDGLPDQPDPQRKKLGLTVLRRLLEANQDLNLAQQRTLLEATLAEHQGTTPQRDDVAVIGGQV